MILDEEELVTTMNPRLPVPVAGTPGDVAEIDSLAINTIRTLSMDAVQAANSGHPGTPMALAPLGACSSFAYEP